MNPGNLIALPSGRMTSAIALLAMLLGVVVVTAGVASASNCTDVNARRPYSVSGSIEAYGEGLCPVNPGYHELKVTLVEVRAFFPDDNVNESIDNIPDSNGDYKRYVYGCHSGTKDYKTVADLSGHGQAVSGTYSLTC